MTEPGADVVFYQAGGMVVALWDRAKLADGQRRHRRQRRLGRRHAGAQRPLARGGRRGDRAGEGGRRDHPPRGAATFWGGYSGVFIDPDGHPWEVAHNPFWTINPDGSITR